MKARLPRKGGYLSPWYSRMSRGECVARTALRSVSHPLSSVIAKAAMLGGHRWGETRKRAIHA